MKGIIFRTEEPRGPAKYGPKSEDRSCFFHWVCVDGKVHIQLKEDFHGIRKFRGGPWKCDGSCQIEIPPCAAAAVEKFLAGQGELEL